MSSAAAAGIRAFGVDRGLPFPLPDLAAADTILLAGSNVAETMPPFMRWISEQSANGGKLIVIDPRLTPTARQATLHLQITPGTDLALANGLLHLAIAGGEVTFFDGDSGDMWQRVGAEVGLSADVVLGHARGLMDRLPDAFADAAREAGVAATGSTMPAQLVDAGARRVAESKSTLSRSPHPHRHRLI